MQYTFSLIYFFSAAIFIALAVYAWRFRSAPATGPFLAVLLVGALWAASDAFYILDGTLEGMLFWSSAKFIPIPLLPVAFFLMSFRHYRQNHWWKGRIVAALLVVPALTSFFSVTNNPIFKGRIWLDAGTGFPEMHFHNGPWYWVHIAYTYILMGAGLLLLIASLRGAQALYRRQTLTLIVGSSIPMLVDVLLQLGVLPLHDPAPLAFTVAGLIDGWALLRYQILDVRPVAHNLVIEQMAELMFVVDEKGRVVDLNPSAAAALGVDPKLAIGRPAESILPQWGELHQRYSGKDSVQCELTLSVGGETRVYAMSLLTIKSGTAKGGAAGRLALLHNITESKNVEEALREANIHLQEQLTQIKDLQARLREQAIRDPLTGLYNRRYLEERLGQELEKARREKYPVSIIMVDIDYFKHINDTWGHAAGDNVLKAVSALFIEHARASDIVCRFGGEEFMLVLPNVAPDIAFERAEQWRKLCEGLRVPNGADLLQCTLSFGVASYPADGGDTSDVVRAADAALYAAKAAGRNHTVQAGTSLLTAVLRAG